MFTSTVVRWKEDLAWVRHPAAGDLFFYRKDAAPAVRTRWAELRGMTVRFDLCCGKVVNVQF